jgi:F-type H+/Na+-transporting ATPase subunit alpha
MKQPQYAPLTIAEMAVSLFAVNEGYLDDVDLKKIVEFERALHSYVRSSHGDLLARINESGDYDAEIEEGLRKALEDFKANHAW